MERTAERLAADGWLRRVGRLSLDRLAMTTVVLSYILILIGGVVRIEGAGMGCGDDWPVCNGAVVPTFTYLTTIEYLHRVVAGLILVLTAWLAIATWRSAKRSDVRRWLAVAALVLVLAQAGLGAITVFAELDPRAVTAHLGMAEAYFAIMIVITLAGGTWQARHSGPTSPPILGAAIVAAALAFALLLTGAYTAASGAAWACPQWPLCGDAYFPTGWTLVDIHVLHRWLALVTTLSIAWLAVAAFRDAGSRSRVMMLALAALALTLVEVVVGAANIWLELADWVRISHLAVATLVWGSLIITIAEARGANTPLPVPEAQ